MQSGQRDEGYSLGRGDEGYSLGRGVKGAVWAEG